MATTNKSQVGMQIPLMKPTFDHEEEQAVVGVLRTGWVTQGPAVAEFERIVAEYVGVDHGVAVTSCTTALLVSLLAMDIGEGDEVICPSHSYIATANSIVHAGATPVFADINLETYGLDAESVESKITPRTKAIMPVHNSRACDIDAIYEVADRHDLMVLEDAAPAIGASYKGRMVGNSRGPVSFSFHPRKILTTGEGGMVMTNDSALADKMRLLRHHYMSVSDVARHNSTDLLFDEYEDVGYNFRMTDIQAAVGIAQMGKLQRILDERRALAKMYNETLVDIPAITPNCPPEYTHTYQTYVLRLTEDSPVSRNDFLREMKTRGIATKQGIMNAHTEQAYIKRMGKVSLPVSEYVHDNTVVLPLYFGMTEPEQAYVVENVKNVLS